MQWEPSLNAQGPAPHSRKGHTLTLLSTTSTLLLFGGEDANGNLVNDMYLYDIPKKTWTNPQYTTTDNPLPRQRHTTTAISPHAIIVIGGETTETNKLADMGSTGEMDVWLFDLRTYAWTRVGVANDHHNPPAWRSCHTAVYMTLPHQSAAIYIFGGFFGTQVCDTSVFRLRIADWTWHKLHISLQGSAITPCHRELHSAVYCPALSGMLVIGGESDDVFHTDVWLLSQTTARTKQWKWKQLIMRMAQNLPENSLPPASDACVVVLPTDRPMVMVWGGMSDIDRLNSLDMAYVIDLASLQSLRVSVNGCRKHTGRILHAVVRYADRVFLSGGIDERGDVTADMQCLSLTGVLKGVSRSQAVDFGALADRIAKGLGAPEEAPEDEGMQVDTAGLSGAGRLMGPASVLEGTAFSGRVTHCSRYGAHVSVVIGGKVHEGMLIAYAAGKGADKGLKEEVERATAGGDKVIGGNDVVGDGDAHGDAHGDGNQDAEDAQVPQDAQDEQEAGTDQMEITRDEPDEEIKTERNDEDSLSRQMERKRRLDAVNSLPDPEDTVKRRPELDNNNNEVILLD